MALTTLPTRTDASVGASPKRNRRTVRDRQTCIPAEEYEALADSVVAVCADVGTDTSPAAGSLKKRMADAEGAIDTLTTASGTAVLWEWNGTDLSQFDAAEGDAGFAWSVTTWSARYPGLAGIDDTPAIRCDSPNVAPRINFLPIKASELPATMPTRFAMVARMGCSNANAVPMLISYWENATHWFGAFRNVTQFVYSRRDNGVWTDGLLINTVAGTADVFHSGDYCKLNAHVVPATPASRPLVAVGLSPDNPTAPTRPNWYANSLQANYNASWLGLTHNPRVGIACRAWHNVAVSPGHLFADLKIVEVP